MLAREIIGHDVYIVRVAVRLEPALFKIFFVVNIIDRKSFKRLTSIIKVIIADRRDLARIQSAGEECAKRNIRNKLTFYCVTHKKTHLFGRLIKIIGVLLIAQLPIAS